MASPRLTGAITHGIPIGRAGDYLLWYIKAKYVTHRSNLTFLLNPPTDHLVRLGLDRLNFCKKEKLLTDHLYLIGEFKKIKSGDDIYKHAVPCYVVDHEFRAKNWEYNPAFDDVTYWKDVLGDKSFRDKLREMIAIPDSAIIQQLLPPKDRLSVALHIRTGNLWDTEGNKKTWYYKFPDLDFYAQSLKKLHDLFDRQALFVHLFTDDPYPVELVQQLMQKVDRPAIRFRYPRTNSPLKLILEDLMAMKEYDCLIRGMSAFAQVAQIIGNHKVVLYPKKFDGRHVTQIGMLSNVS